MTMLLLCLAGLQVCIRLIFAIRAGVFIVDKTLCNINPLSLPVMLLKVLQLKTRVKDYKM